MKKKLFIGSVFAVLLMLSIPAVSNIQAQPVAVINKESSICASCDSESTAGIVNLVPCIILFILWSIVNVATQRVNYGGLFFAGKFFGCAWATVP